MMTLRADPGCPHCAGRGFVEEADGTSYACECIVRDAHTGGDDAARIPAKYRSRSFASFKIVSAEHRTVLDRALQYVENFTMEPPPASDSGELLRSECNGLMLLGPPGTGKTHLAVAVLRDLMARGHRGLFWNVNDLFREMRDRIAAGDGDAETLEAIADVDVLVLDDLCSQKDTAYVQDRLYAIINRRYDDMRPVIVTSNLSAGKLIDILGDRLHSRMREMCELVHMPEGDYRLARLGYSAFSRTTGRGGR